jgi:cell division protein FtsQ
VWQRTRNRKKSRDAAPPRFGFSWRAAVKALATSGAVLATLMVVFWALNQPIRTVRVTGSFQHIAPGQIEQIVARQVRGQGLLTVKLAAVGRAIHTLPWVDAVSVERDWPYGLSVLVVEQVAAARWGRDGLVNSGGVLFAAGIERFPPGLARLSGPDGSESEVTQRYLAMQRRLFGPSWAAPVRDRQAPARSAFQSAPGDGVSQQGLTITAVRLDARGAWQLDLANGITVRLGRSQVDERFEKFMSAALGIVRHRAGDISYVDMRYTNGFAIGWRSGASHA